MPPIVRALSHGGINPKNIITMDKNNSQEPKHQTLGGLPGVEAVQTAGIARVNKKIIIWSAVAIVAVLAIAGGLYWSHYSGTKKANEAIGKADMEQNDSIRFEMYKKIADDADYDANNRARIMVAGHLYKDGKYQEALNYLDKADMNGERLEAGICLLKGDCYANLNKLDDALGCYNDALKKADNNPAIMPYVMLKLANVYRAQKKYDKEYEEYLQIQSQYPAFMGDIDKYVERAKIQAGK